MRAVAPLVMLALLAGAGASTAQPLLTDPEGDVEYAPLTIVAALPALPAPTDAARASDLVALHASETDDDVVFAFEVAALDPEGASVVASVEFGFGARDWRVRASAFQFGDDELRVGTLSVREGDEWDFVARLEPPVLDAAASALVVPVPKTFLVAADGRIPGRGDALEIRSVWTDTPGIGFGLAQVRARDRMPDDGPTAVAFPITRGDFSQGDLVLTADDRVRVSNGGATTFVFLPRFRNTADAEAEFALSVADLPEGWNATFQTPIRVPAGEERTVSLLVSVPFAHEHGGFSGFNLSVEHARDAATTARMRLGVLHTPIPQPAGHHAELYLHADAANFGPLAPVAETAFPFAFGWLNTLADHAEDGAFVTPGGSGSDGVRWFLPLNPSLQTGLDFDLDRVGTLQASIVGRRSGEVEVRAHVEHRVGSDEPTILAESPKVPITLDLQEPTPFELSLTPLAASDYVAYERDANLVLVLSMSPGDVTDRIFFPTPTEPRLLVEDFVLSLPLNEYHDKLTGAADVAQVIEIAARGPVEKRALPGTLVTYAFDVRNSGQPDVHVLTLAGNAAYAGVLIPRGQIVLGPEARDVTVAVEVPLDANDGEEFEIILFVHARDDPSRMAIARTKTVATHAAADATPDETQALNEARARNAPTPAPGVVGLLVAVGLALRRRR